jgi:hypothetical protein
MLQFPLLFAGPLLWLRKRHRPPRINILHNRSYTLCEGVFSWRLCWKRVEHHFDTIWSIAHCYRMVCRLWNLSQELRWWAWIEPCEWCTWCLVACCDYAQNAVSVSMDFYDIHFKSIKDNECYIRSCRKVVLWPLERGFHVHGCLACVRPRPPRTWYYSAYWCCIFL